MEIARKKWFKLRPGDRVEIIAPGWATSKSNVRMALKRLNDWDLHGHAPKNLFGKDVICSNTDTVRERHFRDALKTKSKIIWCLRGGYGSIRLLQNLIKIKPPKEPKLVIGYSDITSLFGLLIQKWKWPVLHGPLIDGWGQKKLKPSDEKLLKKILFGEISSIKYPNLIPLNKAARANKTIRSRVIGGNIVVYISTLKLPWHIDESGSILFFEDIGERGYRIDRELMLLKQHGILKKVKAMVFGDFIGGEEPTGGSKVWSVIERFAQEQKFPVFRGLKAGHGKNKIPIPFNTSAVLRCGKRGELVVDTGVQK